MFSRGTSELIDRLPELDGLDPTWTRRRLSEAYLEILAARNLVDLRDQVEINRDVRRLVNALELYVVSRPLEDPHVPAAAFVAAEALELSGSRLAIEVQQSVLIEAGLLFVIAGFDANAAAVVGSISIELTPTSRMRALAAVVDLLRQAEPVAAATANDDGADRQVAITSAIWTAVHEAVRGHHAWLRGEGQQEHNPGPATLSELAETLTSVAGAASRYSAPFLFVRLLERVFEATERRSLRRLADIEGLDNYVALTVPGKPLLWPAAQIYAETCLPALDHHAAVAVPTGSGKSGVAELAVVRALSEGWCLYLAPTNALVGQIRRDLRDPVARVEGQLRTFVGGGEFTTEETLTEDVGRGDVFVMTPEKCALALRQTPDAFKTLRLLVVDECHLIGSGGSRGVTVELVTSEILARAPDVAVLLMSALVSNAVELAGWLETATGRLAVPIEEPWRPTRTLRGVVGIDRDSWVTARESAASAIVEKPNRVARYEVPLSTMVGLQGAWATTGAREDFAVLGLRARVEGQFRAKDPNGDVAGWRNRAAEAITTSLANAGEHVLTFVPANKHEVISVAREVASARPASAPSDEVRHLLELAEYELGELSEVATLLENGVATHSAALIDEERRATEQAFGGRAATAQVMVATTSLAQGLNLPATVVVIAGTKIGHGGEGGPRASRDLLNAIGRAGRPFVANRSVALIVPSNAALMSPTALPSSVLNAARFIGLEDAAVPLESQLLSLLRQNPEHLASLDAMTDEEIAAFTYLPISEGSDAAGILQHSLGFHQRRLDIGPPVDETLRALRQLGTNFLAAGQTPEWLVGVAYAAGVDLRAVAALYSAASTRPAEARSVSAWADTLIGWMRTMPAAARELLCPLGDTPEPLLRGLRTDDVEAWDRFSSAVGAYLGGGSLADIASVAFEAGTAGGRRSSGDPLPKAITLVRQVFSYRMSMAAGAVVAIVEAAQRNEDQTLALDADVIARLEHLPLSLRLGAGSDDARLWARYGFGGRRLAHLLARLRPVPPDVTAESALRAWTRGQLHALGEDFDALGALDDRERRAVVAAAATVT